MRFYFLIYRQNLIQIQKLILFCVIFIYYYEVY